MLQPFFGCAWPALPVLSSTEATLFQSQIDTTHHQIDALVYELYGLTDEEIKLVEGLWQENHYDVVKFK